jgi:hypothetical protein
VAAFAAETRIGEYRWELGGRLQDAGVSLGLVRAYGLIAATVSLITFRARDITS